MVEKPLMPMTINKVLSTSVEITLVLLSGTSSWVVPKCQLGGAGAILAHKKGDVAAQCTLGSFRTKDGSAMQPDYQKLRGLLKFRQPREACYYA